MHYLTPCACSALRMRPIRVARTARNGAAGRPPFPTTSPATLRRRSRILAPMASILFKPLQLGALTLPNRVVMPALTRTRAGAAILAHNVEGAQRG